MEFSSPATAFLLLALTIVVMLLALRLLVASWAQRAAVAERSALELAEKRAARLRYRLDRRLLRTGIGSQVDLRLKSAGVETMVVDFLALCIGSLAAGFLLADLFLPTWLAALVGLAAVRACLAWIGRQRERRRQAFIVQLPEIARILSNASSAGLAIRAAIEMAATELDDPARSEMGLVAEELNLGQSVDRALQNLELRMPSRDVGVLISTLVIQQRSGGDLVHALQDMAATLDNRRDLTREIRTVMAGSVFTGYMVAILGIGTVLLMNLISPGVLEELTSSVPGLIAVSIAGAFYLVGFLLIRKVTRVEV